MDLEEQRENTKKSTGYGTRFHHVNYHILTLILSPMTFFFSIGMNRSHTQEEEKERSYLTISKLNIETFNHFQQEFGCMILYRTLQFSLCIKKSCNVDKLSLWKTKFHIIFSHICQYSYCKRINDNSIISQLFV